MNEAPFRVKEACPPNAAGRVECMDARGIYARTSSRKRRFKNNGEVSCASRYGITASQEIYAQGSFIWVEVQLKYPSIVGSDLPVVILR